MRGISLSALCALFLAASSAATVGAAPNLSTRDRNPVFSPAGKAIAFARWYANGTSRIMLVNRDGRGLRFLTPLQPSQYGLSWSPDGRSLAYTSGRDIWRVDLASRVPVDLTNDPTSDNWQPAWSPDGHWIAYDAFDAVCFRCTTLHLVSPDGAQRKNVPVKGYQARRPTWSPDGTKLALSLSDDLIVDLDGNDVVRGFGGSYVTYSPDGGSLAWTSDGLIRFDIATQTKTRLPAAMKQYPMWSRDGSEIAGTGFRGRLLIVGAADGHTVAEVTSAATIADAPSWGADNRIAFVHKGLCGIDIAWGDGTHVHRLTRVC